MCVCGFQGFQNAAGEQGFFIAGLHQVSSNEIEANQPASGLAADHFSERSISSNLGQLIDVSLALDQAIQRASPRGVTSNLLAVS